MQFCVGCGTELPDDASFCARCGRRTFQASPPPPPPPPPSPPPGNATFTGYSPVVAPAGTAPGPGATIQKRPTAAVLCKVVGVLAIAGALASLIGQFPFYVQGEYALINSGKANLVANFSVIGLLLIAGALLLFGSRAKHLSLIGLGMATVLGCVAFAGRFSDAALLLSSDQSAAGGWWISSFADLLTVVAGLVAVIALIAIGIRFRSGSMSPWVMLFGLLGLLIIIASNRLDRVDMVLHAPDGRTYSQAVGNLFSSFGWGDSGHVLTWVIAVSVVVMSALVLPRLVGIAALATVVVWMAVLDICTLAANAWGQQSLGYLGHPGYWATGSIRASFLLTVFGWLLMALAALLMFVSRWDVADAELASNSSSVSIGVASTMQ